MITIMMIAVMMMIMMITEITMKTTMKNLSEITFLKATSRPVKTILQKCVAHLPLPSHSECRARNSVCSSSYTARSTATSSSEIWEGTRV